MDEKVSRRDVFRKFLVDSVSSVSRLLLEAAPDGSTPIVQAPGLTCHEAGVLLHSRKTRKNRFSLHSDDCQKMRRSNINLGDDPETNRAKES